MTPTDKTIDALTMNYHAYRSHLDPVTGKIKTICISLSGLLKGFSTYALEHGNDSSHYLSLVLCFDWDLGSLVDIRGQIEIAAELQHFLAVQDIPLCPHKQMNGSAVVNAIFEFVKHPLSQHVTTTCDSCHTEIKVCSSNMEGDDQICHVMTKRCLGTVAQLNYTVF